MLDRVSASMQGGISRWGGALFAALCLCLAFGASASWAAAPPNDDFGNAQSLSGALPIEVSGTNAGATWQAGEPTPLPASSAGHSVWFRWEATTTEVVTVSTCASEFSPKLGVYLGDSLASLTEVVRSAWEWPVCELEGGVRATFRAVAGKTYSIQVDGNGAFELQISHRPPPANDDFANATTIPLDSTFVSASNFGATKEPGEPAHEGDPGGASVWFEFTAPRTGGVLLRRGEEPDDHQALVGVYTGSSVGDLTTVPMTDVRGGGLAFQEIAGVTYHLAVDGRYNPVTESPFMGQPAISLSNSVPNDDFENAYAIPLGGPLRDYGWSGSSNIGATKQPGEPDHAGNRGGSSIWFRWEPSESGSVALSVCSSFPTLLAAYTGSSVSELTPVAATGTPQGAPCPYYPQAPYRIDAGVVYRIAVDGSDGAWGTFGMEIRDSSERLPSTLQAGSAPLATRAKPPRTRVARAHAKRGSRVAVFHLRSDEPGSIFRCKLDSHRFAACKSTVVYRHLKPGRHTFRSEAVNSSGETDHSPAVVHFRIR